MKSPGDETLSEWRLNAMASWTTAFLEDGEDLHLPDMMSHDHRFIRNLVQLRAAPRVPIVWLLIPWLAGLWWSVSIARALVPAPAAQDVGWAYVFVMIMGRFLLVGGLGTVATWAWLYFTWPEHPRVLCWAAAAGFMGLWFRPATTIAIVPLFVTLCMCGAIVEQALTSWRTQGEQSCAAPLSNNR